MIRSVVIGAAALLVACGSPDPEAEFFARMGDLCGERFAGTIVSTDAEDADWRAEPITVHVETCAPHEIRMPLAVGEDTSRTWILRKIAGGGLELRHQHLHSDGTPDAISNYGGYSNPDVTSGDRQSFAASIDTKALFDAEGIPVSKDNVWAMEVRPEAGLLAYEMARPNRFFRIEFDTTAPLGDGARDQ
ncbi:MAG: hypothetical protein AAFQ22_09835 [Pseudomonadota bacterium]